MRADSLPAETQEKPKNTGNGEETQAGIKIAGRNINHLRYADDITLMAESEEELKSPLMKVKVESEKVGLKLNIQKTKIMAQAGALPQSISTPRKESGSLCHYVACVATHTEVSR